MTGQPQPITLAVQGARAQGFTGEVVEWTKLGDDLHELYLVTCSWPDGTAVHVVAADAHEGGGSPRMMPLSDVVHLVQNATEAERWAISLREPHGIGEPPPVTLDGD